MAYGITSESQLIDKGTIIAGCNELKKAAESFDISGTLIKSTSKRCTKEVLSVDNQTLEPVVAEVGKNVSKANKDIEGIADAIISEANRIYNEQKAELKEYLKKQKEQNQ